MELYIVTDQRFRPNYTALLSRNSDPSTQHYNPEVKSRITLRYNQEFRTELHSPEVQTELRSVATKNFGPNCTFQKFRPNCVALQSRSSDLSTQHCSREVKAEWHRVTVKIWPNYSAVTTKNFGPNYIALRTQETLLGTDTLVITTNRTQPFSSPFDLRQSLRHLCRIT
jgi:hypothetical protein